MGLDKQKVLLLLKVLVSIALITWLVLGVEIDFSNIGHALFTPYFWLGFLLIVLNTFGQAWRWRNALQIFDINVSLLISTKVTLIGMFFQTTTIGAIGGEAARTYYLKKFTLEKLSKCASASILDRIVGLFTMSLTGVIASLLIGLTFGSFDKVHFILSICAFASAIIMAFLLTGYFIAKINIDLSHKWLSFFENGANQVHAFFKYPYNSLKMLGISLLSNLMLIISLIMLSMTLGTTLSIFEASALLPPIVIANSLPISIGGLGVGEAAAEGVFRLLDFTNGAAAMVLIRISMWAVSIFGGVLYLQNRN